MILLRLAKKYIQIYKVYNMVETKTVKSGILDFTVETGEVDETTNYVSVATKVNIKLAGIEAEQQITLLERDIYPTRSGTERIEKDERTANALIRKMYLAIYRGWERGVLETFYPAANARIKYEIEDLHK